MAATYLMGRQVVSQLEVSQLKRANEDVSVLQLQAHAKLAADIAAFLVKNNLIEFDEFDAGKFRVYEARLNLE